MQAAKPNNQLIAQRWDGFGHTIAYFIHSKTDVFLYTPKDVQVSVKDVANVQKDNKKHISK